MTRGSSNLPAAPVRATTPSSMSVRAAKLRLATTHHQVLRMLAAGVLVPINIPGRSIQVDTASVEAYALELGIAAPAQGEAVHT